MLLGLSFALREVAVDGYPLAGEGIVVDDQFCVRGIDPLRRRHERVDLREHGVFLPEYVVEIVDDRRKFLWCAAEEFPHQKRRDIREKRGYDDPPHSGLILRRRILDLDPAGVGEEHHRLPARSVDGDADIVLVLDRETLLHKDFPDQDTLDIAGEEFPGGLKRCRPFGHQDAAGLSAPTDVHLRFQHHTVAEVRQVCRDLLRRSYDHSLRDRYSVS